MQPENLSVAYSVAERYNFDFVWFKDKAGREVLLSYSAYKDTVSDEKLHVDESIVFDDDFLLWDETE